MFRMTRRTILATGLGAVAATALGAMSLSSPTRTDCPGKIVCPLTGELVCRDGCPLGEQAGAEATPAAPACCRAGG